MQPQSPPQPRPAMDITRAAPVPSVSVVPSRPASPAILPATPSTPSPTPAAVHKAPQQQDSDAVSPNDPVPSVSIPEEHIKPTPKSAHHPNQKNSSFPTGVVITTIFVMIILAASAVMIYMNAR